MDNEKSKFVSKKKIKKIFKDIDKNENNIISKKEFYKYLRTNILNCFVTKKNKTKCTLCNKIIFSPFNEIIARYHFTKEHGDELENLENDIRKRNKFNTGNYSIHENDIYFTYICYDVEISFQMGLKFFVKN